MKLTQTYDTWQRALWAVAHCWRAVDGIAHDRIDTLEALNKEGTLPQVVLDCAAALGIERRTCLPWEESDDPQILRATYKGHFAMGGYCGKKLQWAMRWTLGKNDLDIRVLGHSTREAALEHFERLLACVEAEKVQST